MATVSLPQARIPIAWVMVNGQRMPAEIDMEWMRALLGLLNRVGGTSGDDVTLLFQSLSVAPISPVAEVHAAASQNSIAPVFEPLPVAETADSRLQSLEAQVHLLASQINDIRQGYQV